MNLYTIGFSQKSAEEFFKILKSNNVIRLIDIRLNNKSQLAGFTNIKHLQYFLKIHGIEYFLRFGAAIRIPQKIGQHQV